MLDAADRREPVGKRGDSVALADEHVSPLHPEGAIGDVSSSSEVAEHLLETAVGPGYLIVAGDRPGDAGASSCSRAAPEPPA